MLGDALCRHAVVGGVRHQLIAVVVAEFGAEAGRPERAQHLQLVVEVDRVVAVEVAEGQRLGRGDAERRAGLAEVALHGAQVVDAHERIAVGVARAEGRDIGHVATRVIDVFIDALPPSEPECRLLPELVEREAMKRSMFASIFLLR